MNDFEKLVFDYVIDNGKSFDVPISHPDNFMGLIQDKNIMYELELNNIIYQIMETETDSELRCKHTNSGFFITWEKGTTEKDICHPFFNSLIDRALSLPNIITFKGGNTL